MTQLAEVEHPAVSPVYTASSRAKQRRILQANPSPNDANYLSCLPPKSRPRTLSLAFLFLRQLGLALCTGY
ncbi:hypothetical protein I7I53_09243 [Histoplasma capsulatum var. duboisii H88]|uniref:Uncharacterized protein n=1 Tax=Ajellomyces capsulatus (strain H88) TaxID=544711 RepID=A0A8A1L4X6_AJEC8|nr:hypothetical protein I7I53_09243 [Histoplasma capsulatum var. duboisii H88]